MGKMWTKLLELRILAYASAVENKDEPKQEHEWHMIQLMLEDHNKRAEIIKGILDGQS
jgi:hypothetical protein